LRLQRIDLRRKRIKLAEYNEESCAKGAALAGGRARRGSPGGVDSTELERLARTGPEGLVDAYAGVGPNSTTRALAEMRS
jgi:hypothetical protein